MKKTNHCPECGSQQIQQVSGETNCKNCGLILEDTTLEQPIITQAHKDRATAPYLSIAGSKTPEGRVYKSSWMFSTREKNYQTEARKIETIGLKLNLPRTVIQEAKIIFKKAQNQNLSIGRDNQSLTYASIYLACKIHNLPKTPWELTAYTETTQKDLMTATRNITRNLQIKNMPADPLDLLPRFATRLDLKPQTINLITEILQKIKNTKITAGKRPETILAGTIYFAGKKTQDIRTQRQIANTTGVIEVTIRKTNKELLSY